MQGLIDFAVLLEQAEPSHRENLIQLAQQQDAEFLYRVMRKVVFFDELVYMEESLLAEIMANVTPKILAYAIVGVDEEFRKKIEAAIGHRGARLLLDEADRVGNDPNSPHVIGARRQVLKIARALEKQGKITFELNDCPRFRPKRKSVAGEKV